MTQTTSTDEVRYDALGLDDSIVASLASRGITHPFPIQAAAIPDALAGRDICGKAKTGSGKTFAFGLPSIQLIDSSLLSVQAIVLVPTRELCSQVASELEFFAHEMGVGIVQVYGGVSMSAQINALEAGAQIVVATPGRLIDLSDRGAMKYADVKLFVLDEADQMVDMGFMPQVEYIWRQVPEGHQSFLFSATLDGVIDRLAKRRLNDPAFHSVVIDDETMVDNMDHRFLQVHFRDKVKVVAAISETANRTLVFTHTKRQCDRVAESLIEEGLSAAAIHGDLPQVKRERVLEKFSKGSLDILVATNVAARGIHVDDIGIVIHYDPPQDGKEFVHRSGRTARAGSKGLVVTLVEWDQQLKVLNLMKEAGLDHEIVQMFSNDERLKDLHGWEPPRQKKLDLPPKGRRGRR
jgi:superfamily II DNA/RNA helicase